MHTSDLFECIRSKTCIYLSSLVEIEEFPSRPQDFLPSVVVPEESEYAGVCTDQESHDIRRLEYRRPFPWDCIEESLGHTIHRRFCWIRSRTRGLLYSDLHMS